MSERVFRVRLEMDGHAPGQPVWITSEADARKAEAAGYAVKTFVSETEDEPLREAIELLDNARCDLNDPALRRRWGQRRKALRDRLH